MRLSSLLLTLTLSLTMMAATPSGSFVTYGNDTYYEIADCDAMQPFFISLASDDDLWMYISSTGALTCGRQNPDKSFFPYDTDDQIMVSGEQTGPKTIIRIMQSGKYKVWEPFSDRQAGTYDITRAVAKSVIGNRLRFTETNHTLGLRFAYEWCAARTEGWVRHIWITNLKKAERQIEVLDGVQNVVPAGVDRYTVMNLPTLVDAYKRTEQVPSTDVVLFTMEATLVDRAEPSESLTANAAYFWGLPNPQIMTSARQLDAFRRGQAVKAEPLAKGVRGAALAFTEIALPKLGAADWYQVLELRLDAAQVRDFIAKSKDPKMNERLEAAMTASTNTLRDIVALNDGIMQTADPHTDARHFANTLFNTMRGGFYCDEYTIRAEAFCRHITLFNVRLAKENAAFLASLPETLTLAQLEAAIADTANTVFDRTQMMRLCWEYLPVTFSRRHGDPSRPWNLFNIRVNDADGKRIISYQGNWRDIFQNWEALSMSYPDFTNSIIAKFLNATTRDGYNPYRITSEGIDWEVANPADPWSNIGYWGDHQIIYLQKLLELSYNHHPQALTAMLNEPVFAFANVPYRIKSYDEIVADPKATIRFDMPLHKQLTALARTYGADAKLVMAADSMPMLVTMTDKLLVTLLTKLSNFIPEAGIWMNTLRPEWNDANNALVGNGASMVTLCYMRRMVAFLTKLYASAPEATYTVTAETAAFLSAVNNALVALNTMPSVDDHSRRTIADLLGRAGETYRNAVYDRPSAGSEVISRAQLASFFGATLKALDASIRANHRPDGLYHAYNLVAFGDNTVTIEHLYEMLEGQVAVLSSGLLTPAEANAVLDAMRTSALYRKDQRSYILYPFRQLPSFMLKNTFSMADAAELQSAIDAHIVLKDRDGNYHFCGDINNAASLAWLIDRYNESEPKSPITAQQKDALLQLFEQTFHHHAFTGRSGSMYKYEGLGSIYWHMVSKLELAIAEYVVLAEQQNAPANVIEALKKHYFEVQEGIGSHKTPGEYGSFPFDAYSHTPSMSGVQQPGMTGQVKEDILSHFIELGIRVHDGAIAIEPTLLRKDLFLKERLSFDYCGVEFEYVLDGEKMVEVLFSNGAIETLSDRLIPAALADHIHARDHQIKKVIVHIAL